MQNSAENITLYCFMCPPPCNREIMVEANSKHDAIDKIILAGAISCRNSRCNCLCEKAHFDMPPITIEQLKNIVSLSIRGA